MRTIEIYFVIFACVICKEDDKSDNLENNSTQWTSLMKINKIIAQMTAESRLSLFCINANRCPFEIAQNYQRFRKSLQPIQMIFCQVKVLLWYRTIFGCFCVCFVLHEVTLAVKMTTSSTVTDRGELWVLAMITALHRSSPWLLISAVWKWKLSLMTAVGLCVKFH